MTHLHISVPAITRDTLARIHELKMTLKPRSVRILIYRTWVIDVSQEPWAPASA